MVALGPRVGGAHVTVSAKGDMNSFDAIGKRIHQQLTSIGDHNKSVYQSIGRESVTAWRAALGATVAAAPLMGSLISGLAGGATLLGGAVYSVGQSSAGLLPIFTSLGVAGYTLSVGMRNFSAAVSEVDPKKLQLLLKDMPKSMQAAVMSTRELSNEMRAAIWPKLFDGLSSGINDLRETGVVQRGLGAMAESLNGLAKSVLAYANTKEGIKTLNTFFQGNAKVFEALSKSVVPFLDGFLRLVNALTPAAIRLSGRITDIAERFQSWTQAEGFGKRIDDSMKGAEKTAGLLFKVLGNLGSAIANIFGAANPATNNFLQMLVNVTQRFEDFTASAGGQNKIAKWAQQSVGVMRQFGETIGAVFGVIAELADPRVIKNFLKTVEDAFKHLGKLPLDKLVDGFVKIAKAVQPLSSLFLAVIIGGAALNVLVGSMMGQLGGLFGVFKRFTGFGDIFKGIGGSAGKEAGKLSKFTGILKGVGSVLGKALKFAGIAGLVVWIGKLIFESEKLQGKVKDAFGAFKGLWEPLKTAFSEIKASLAPVGKALGPVFEWLDKIATIGIGLILDTIIFAFESLGNVIKGAGRIIAGVIDFFYGLFTLDGSKMLDGLKKIGSGILPLLKGIFGLFITFFAPARLLKLGALAFKGLGRGLASGGSKIMGFIKGLVETMILKLMYLVPRLLKIGKSAIGNLWNAIKTATPKVLSAAGRIVSGVIGWIVKLPGRLLQLGKDAILGLGGAVVKNTPKVLSAAGRIFSGIIGWIGRLPGKLLDLGKLAITKLWDAVKGGASRLKTAASSIFHAIWDEISGLPGKMLGAGKAMIGGIIDGITEKIGDLKDKAGEIAGMLKGFLPGSPVKEGPLKAWNYGGDATGGGRNVIDAITGGLKDTDPIRKAMAGVASAVSGSLVAPTVGNGAARVDTGRVSEGTPGGNVYIGNMAPHNYGEFERQIREKKRLAALGGRKPVVA